MVMGVGSAARSVLVSAESADDRARAAARRDVDATLEIAKCPACCARDSAAVQRWWVRNALGPLAFIGIALGVLLFIARPISFMALASMIAVWLIGVPYFTWSQWKATQLRVQWK